MSLLNFTFENLNVLIVAKCNVNEERKEEKIIIKEGINSSKV